MATHPTVTHCIFDMDGLLLNTETFYTIAQQEILREYKREFTWELKSKMMGKKALEAVQIMVKELGLEGQVTPEEIVTAREARLEALFPTAELLPGVDELIRHLHARGVPIAVATSSHRRHFKLKTQNHKDFFSLFNFIITGDDVIQGKPNPDIFLRTAGRFSPEPAPAQCLVFEDAPSGVAAAVAAGMPVVMIPDPNLDRGLCTGATALLESMEQFVPEQWGLPAF